MSSRQVPAVLRLLGPALRVGPLRALAALPAWRRFRVQGTSMEPTLASAEVVWVSRAAYWAASPQRGDVVVLRDPRGQGLAHIKRVVGLPGEHILIAGGRASINGRPLAEPYLAEAGPWSTRRDGQWVMGEGECFVLGDNRDDSLDSRTLGPVPLQLIIGKVRLGSSGERKFSGKAGGSS